MLSLPQQAQTFIKAIYAFGLMMQRSMQPGEGLVIEPCSSIHMMFMLFRSDAVSDKYERTEDYNWRGVSPGLRVVRVSGDHLVLFEEPWVSALAEKLRTELAARRSPLLLT